ncbi:uncharacterized protein F5891DRAFT_440057 [Suillus fuscotomentosus]|uniref:G domain-containing protein n=1 Tax=Suillus fuscotomentosus TaxID=1912939 RepID=A0AAD4E3U3_9AGAM|nr:uncharacterized protein F5891DRAFT_440057 [Suillus fuscotomentosus]KAG1898832.1 hypothetical protein F5891DRAFT_440057 [Suillus fuscotomentosus]
MANALHASTALCIHGITVDLSKSKTNVKSAEVRINKHSPIELEREAKKSLRWTFSPPMVLLRGDSFVLRMHYKKHFRTKHEDVAFNLDDMSRAYNARQEYIKLHEKFSIVVDLVGNTSTDVEHSVTSGQSSEPTTSGQSLEPTTSGIFQRCPRFRILVIGKSGVGKSSLISQAFGVEKEIVAHNKPGEAHIDKELISSRNERFVLHDSKGFEPGEEDNLEIVRDFIDRRRKMSSEHQLHAVWLCFEIPRAGGRLLETGTEEFLKSKNSGSLGNVPVIVVLTKYDMLIERIQRALGGSSLSDEAYEELTKKNVEAELQDTCIGPLERFAGANIPHATVSTDEDYEGTLTHLIQITEKCVSQHSASEASATASIAQHFASEAAVMTSIAQRVHPGLKIKASIEVGKKRYWKALTSCPTFKNRKMWDCLHVLHTDIVNVWNFHDPHHYLHSQEFRAMMTNIVDKIEVGPTANPKKTLAFGLSMVGTIAGIVSALAGPAAPIVVPIAAGAVLAKWAYDVYQLSHPALQRFMAYIIHLTLVLQTLFIVSESQELTRRAIKLAVASYLASSMSEEVLTWIQDYDRQLTVLERADRDTMNKIIEVMQMYEINAAQISELRAKVPPVDLLSDEPW